MNYSTGGSPSCFVCNRTAAKFDRMLNEWVCEGNKDCGVSRNTTKPVESSASPQVSKDKSRCTLCGCPRIPITRNKTEFGACTFLECKDPLHDYNLEVGAEG